MRFQSWTQMLRIALIIVAVTYMLGSSLQAQRNESRRQQLLPVPDVVAVQFEIDGIDRRVEALEKLKIEDRMARIETLLETIKTVSYGVMGTLLALAIEAIGRIWGLRRKP